MFEAIREWTAEDKPYLGICVGYQLIFEASDGIARAPKASPSYFAWQRQDASLM